MASRYSGSRYDGDARRSRSRDRSPDRRSLYSDGGPRRSSAESRSNSSAFQTNRDSFRDALPRDPPRGPKALLDPPSGPRGGGYSGDFRGRGRGRGRGWRDDSRDRGRDRDIDFRDRRDASYRDERSRERDRGDWRDRERDSFRGRRPSPRGRSPPGRDFRDARDLRDGPLGVDADRARRGSRDGPLSAGSSSSDPPFGHNSYRGSYSGRGGRGRGRGDWDRARGRPFYEDRDRYGPSFRSRSQEGRYRDRDDRERDNRYLDTDLRPRDPRDPRDTRDPRDARDERDAREIRDARDVRDARDTRDVRDTRDIRDVRDSRDTRDTRDTRDIRDGRDREIRPPKIDRTSHEPPPLSRDVSPPPIAPAAPSFGSVPNRTTSGNEINSLTGKAPPTGPRALKDDRPVPINVSPIAETRPPPTGPSKPSFMERSPPVGPRIARPGPSSKQWINPNLKRVPESPKLGRSQSFAQPRTAGFRPEGTHAEQQAEFSQRPRSSDAKAEPPATDTGGHSREPPIPESGEEFQRHEGRPLSAGSSQAQEHKPLPSPTTDYKDPRNVETKARSVAESAAEQNVLTSTEKTKTEPNARTDNQLPDVHGSLPRKPRKAPVLDQSSESDDEEFGADLESEMTEVEKKMDRLEGAEDAVPLDAITRHALVSLAAVSMAAAEPENLEDMIGPIPSSDVPVESLEKFVPHTEAPPAAAKTPVLEEPKPPLIAKEKTVSPVLSKGAVELPASTAELVQPSIEQDIDVPMNQEGPSHDEGKAKSDGGDVPMEDAPESQPESEIQQPLGPQMPVSEKQSPYPPFEEAQIQSGRASNQASSTQSPPEDDDETDEDVDLQNIEIVREHMATPPLDSLPYFDVKPWYKDPDLLDSPKPELHNFILGRLKDQALERHAREEHLRRIYRANYDNYLRFTLSDDPVAKRSREKFNYIPGAVETNGQKPGLPEAKPESTRRSRYASERDLERILEESRRVEDEKRERAERAEKERYRTDKEAVLPPQYQTLQERDNDRYHDTTGYLGAEKTIAAWEILPPVDNFTEDEYNVFEKAYLEYPKQWGRVSEPLAERDFGTSIQFYYLKKEKEGLNLKEKLRRQPKKRKKGGRGKARSNALASELRGDNENEESQEAGENGESRRRPRRAAAPTFNSEATPATDGESGTPAATPSRRGGAAKAEGGAEKPERKPRGRRAKDKEPKQPRVNQTLAAAPPTGSRGGRSRSSSRVQGPEWIAGQPPDPSSRIQAPYELDHRVDPRVTTAPMPNMPIQAPFPAAQQPMPSPERGVPIPPPGSLSEVMAPPPLRPEPIPQPAVSTLDLGTTPTPDRKSGSTASSYWSVPEANEFPALLRSFGSDWAAIANHMRSKTAVMVKNYYSRKKGDSASEWEAIVQEADARKARGEKRPPPPTLVATAKKRYDSSSNRPLASADVVMEDAPATKQEQPSTTQSMTGRFSMPVPIAAQPQAQPAVVQAPFVQTPPVPSLVQGRATPQPAPQPLSQPVSRTMSPVTRPLRPPMSFASDREREPFLQQSVRTPLVQKPTPPAPLPVSEPPMRHPLPGSIVESQAERHRAEKPAMKETARGAMRVKQEHDMPMHQHDMFIPHTAPSRMASVRAESMSRPPDPPRAVAPAPQAPQAPFSAILQHQPGRGFMNESHPSPPAPPRPLSNLSRPMSGASGGAEPFATPPAQRTPPAVAPTLPRPPPERKTSNLMALLNDDPPAPPKRVAEVPVAVKQASTPPPQSHMSRPPPPPPPPSQVRRESAMPDVPPYGAYGRSPAQPPPPSSMPSLKPYTSASPQTQPLGTPRHMAAALEAERDYFGGRTPRGFASAHQPPVASPPQNVHHYASPGPAGHGGYPPQAPYQYGAQVQPQASSVASPPPQPQYGGHPSAPRGHEVQPSHSREHSWPGPSQVHMVQQQQAQQQQAQPTWASHPPQPPKSTQPPPAQSPWAAQHATPKPPQPSNSVPPQPSWASAPPPRGHEQMALRDSRDVYQPRMQAPLQSPYPPSSRGPEPPHPQAPGGYPRYATPGPHRDPRDSVPPPRSYTPVSAYDQRAYAAQPPPPSHQELREAQLLREHQQSMMQQQLRGPPPPQDRHAMYDRPDRYGR